MNGERVLERIVIHDYTPPFCIMCDCPTEPIQVIDEDQRRAMPLVNGGYCTGCSTLYIQGKGTIVNVEVAI